MPLKMLRLSALLGVTTACLALFTFGLVDKVSFLYTFIGPALLLCFIAFQPNYLYDIVAVAMLLLLTIMALIFSVISVLFNQAYILAFFVILIPISALVTMLYCMEKLKKEDRLYS